MQQLTCQNIDKDFSKQMWSSCIIQTLKVKSTVEILQKFVAFSEYMNFKIGKTVWILQKKSGAGVMAVLPAQKSGGGPLSHVTHLTNQ